MSRPPLPRRHGGPVPAEPGPLGSRRFLDLLLDRGSWRSWDHPSAAMDGSPPDPALLTGEGRLRGTRVALLVGEFGHLAGSVGLVAAERLVRAVERATAERLPLLACPASGGMRMQEGTAAFVRMVEIAGAVAAHQAAGLPYLVYLRHPTTGGVLASGGRWGR